MLFIYLGLFVMSKERPNDRVTILGKDKEDFHGLNKFPTFQEMVSNFIPN